MDPHFTLLGILNEEDKIVINDEVVTIEDALKAWKERYDDIYPMNVDLGKETLDTPLTVKEPVYSKVKVENQLIVIPNLPGQTVNMIQRQIEAVTG